MSSPLSLRLWLQRLQLFELTLRRPWPASKPSFSRKSVRLSRCTKCPCPPPLLILSISEARSAASGSGSAPSSAARAPAPDPRQRAIPCAALSVLCCLRHGKAGRAAGKQRPETRATATFSAEGLRSAADGTRAASAGCPRAAGGRKCSTEPVSGFRPPVSGGHVLSRRAGDGRGAGTGPGGGRGGPAKTHAARSWDVEVPSSGPGVRHASFDRT